MHHQLTSHTLAHSFTPLSLVCAARDFLADAFLLSFSTRSDLAPAATTRDLLPPSLQRYILLSFTLFPATSHHANPSFMMRIYNYFSSASASNNLKIPHTKKQFSESLSAFLLVLFPRLRPAFSCFVQTTDLPLSLCDQKTSFPLPSGEPCKTRPKRYVSCPQPLQTHPPPN